MTPQQYVQEKAAASGSSFYYAFLFLPKPRRAAITAFYAFCREVDDVVDEVEDAGVAAHQAGLVAGRSGQAPMRANPSTRS
jgi:phytoene synthase